VIRVFVKEFRLGLRAVGVSIPTLADEVGYDAEKSRKCHPGHVIFSKEYHPVPESGGRKEKEERRKQRLEFLEVRVACLPFEERPKSSG
jgi:hypothetical protein